MNYLKPMHHTFGPHVDWRYCLQALALLLRPWKWKRGKETENFRKALTEKFSADAFLFSSGREGLLALFRSLNIGAGEEIIIQGYTCTALPNAIHGAGGVPIYADIARETLNLDIEAVRQAITSRTRVVICQHTFGIPSDVTALRALCNEHDLVLIEDCAHIIPDETGPAEIGKYGDFILLSFGRDKAISGIAGGAILSQKEDVSVALKREEEKATDFSLFTIKRLLFYPLFYSIARPLYGLFIGKVFLFLMRKIKLLIPVVTDEEKEGSVSPILHRIPNACAALALRELGRLKQINDHRRRLTRFYLEEGSKKGWPVLEGVSSDLPLQKFPLFVMNAAGIRSTLKKKNIHLDDGWTGCVVCPPGINMDAMNYEPGSDPDAEAAAEMILSLPTHPTMSLEQARKLAKMIDAAL